MKRRRVLLTAAGLGGGAGLASWFATAPPGLSFGGVRAGGDEAPTEADLEQAILSVALTALSETEPTELAWNWGEGVLLLGLHRAARFTAEPRIRSYLTAYYSYHQQRGIDVSWSDDTTPAIALTERMLLGFGAGDKLAGQVVDYVLSAPRSSQGMLLHLGNTRLPFAKDIFPDVWVDSIFHVVPTLLRYAELRGESRPREEAARQLGLFIEHLQDPRSGLVAHGYHDDGTGRQVPPFTSNTFWARGNGWMLATMADALQRLPLDHPLHPVLVFATRQLGLALRNVQDGTGLFHTLLTDSSSYFEAAGSALIVYGLSLATALGVLPESPETRRRDRAALWAMLKWEGRRTVVAGTSLGTNPVQSLYTLTPTANQVSYGVGAWLMAATQLLRSTSESPTGN